MKAINKSIVQLMGSGPYSKAPAGDMSGNITSPVLDIQNVDEVSFQFVWAGTSEAGTLDIQTSNDYTDYNGTVTNAGTWDSVTFSPAIPSPSGSDGHSTAYMALVPSKALRVVYTYSAGTGALTINVVTKGI